MVNQQRAYIFRTAGGVVGACFSNGDIWRIEVTDENGSKKTVGSNHGGHVAVMASGVILLSTYPQNLCSTGTHDVEDTIYFSNGYHMATGTSMAAPIVTGVAALLLSYDSSLSAEEIKGIITASKESYASLAQYCTSGGMVNAFNAIQTLVEPEN